MRLAFATQGLAQAFADRVHAWMIANNLDYAGSVAAGQTTAWAKPYQDLDKFGVPLDTLWYINLKERSVTACSAPERAALLPYKVG